MNRAAPCLNRPLSWKSLFRTRTFSSVSAPGNNGHQEPTAAGLRQMYDQKAQGIERQFGIGRQSPSDFRPRTIFTNSEMSLRDIKVYGFDYDFTLAQYQTKEVSRLIYDLAKRRLVNCMKYPSKMLTELKYDPDFAIRGLHLDTKNGLLMKMDSYHHIQLGAVYKGRKAVCDDDVVDLYKGTHIPLHILDDEHHRPSVDKGTSHMIQFLDTFSLAEVTLFADVLDFMIERNIEHDVQYLYMDVQESVKEIHKSGKLHRKIVTDPDKYIVRNENIKKLLERLKCGGKKLFLLTNSPFDFVNKGMIYLTGSDWINLFDVIIVSARKPQFYSETSPFRVRNLENSSLWWKPVTELCPGCVYEQGSIQEFQKLTKWRGSSVLYIGDHLHSDLTDPALHLGWKTGAIIPELKDEIALRSTKESLTYLANILALDAMLAQHQGYTKPELIEVILSWKKRKAELSASLKHVHNVYFGSVFTTYEGSSYFTRRLARFANLYMSSVDHLMDYSLKHTFYPRRAALPHEPDLNFDYHDE